MTRPARAPSPIEAGPPAYAGIALALSVEDEAWFGAAFGADEDDVEARIHRAVQAAFEGAGIDADVETELGVTLTDDSSVQALNAEWRGKDRPTNVLSFPMDELDEGETPGPMLGDVVLARETVLAEAEAEGKAPADHFVHLVVHGTLHCLGYDHVETGDAERMEALETAILAGLGVADPYATLSDAALADEDDPEPNEPSRS